MCHRGTLPRFQEPLQLEKAGRADMRGGVYDKEGEIGEDMGKGQELGKKRQWHAMSYSPI